MSLPDGGPARTRLAARPTTPTVAELAWIALIPCALVGVVAIAFLGPVVGRLLFTHTTDSLWPIGWWETVGYPEPAKLGRFLIATLAPLLLAAAIVVGARRRPALPARTTRILVHASVALVLAFVAVALIEQHPTFTGKEEPVQEPVAAIFSLDRALLAAILVAAAVALLRRRAFAARLAGLVLETRPRRHATVAVAVAFVAIGLLRALTTDRLGLGVVALNLPWTMNDAAAVLDGRTPLVDYHPIYAKLLPYLTAPVLGAFGMTAFVFTAFMALLAGLALMAVYATLRRLTRSSLLACGLFLPFVATSDIRVPIRLGADAGLETSPMTLASLWPMRYGGAYLLAWLVARHLDGVGPRRVWTLFLAAGVVTIDNMEFGLGATAATVVALLCAQPRWSARGMRSLLAGVAGGLLAAVALVTLITLVRSGHPPSVDMLLEWPRIFTTLGWFSMALPTWDLHLAVYATFVAAIAIAAVRLARHEEDVLLTGMLAWSGVFGLLIGGYFIGRPDVIKLTGLLSAWSFALSMLTVASVRALAAQTWRPVGPHLLVLFGFALSLTPLALLSPPQEQIDRLKRPAQASPYLAVARHFIAERTRPGEKVMVLIPMSYVITHDLGVRNVAPYGFMNAIVAKSQMERLLKTLRRERVSKVFMPAVHSYLLKEGDSSQLHLDLLESAGYVPTWIRRGILYLRRR